MDVYEKTIKIKDSDTLCGRLSLQKLTAFLGDTLLEHRELLKIGGPAFIAKGFGWVIIYNNIKIERLPVADETITIRTWPGEMKLCMSPQRYEIFDEAGDCIVRASSQWMLIDLVKRSMVMPGVMEVKVPVVSFEGEMALPPRKMKFPEQLEQSVMMEVSSDFTDYNRHMNNSYYFLWAEKLLDPAFLESRKPEEIWIEYKKELREGQKVLVSYSLEGNVLYVVGSHENSKCFSIKITYL